MPISEFVRYVRLQKASTLLLERPEEKISSIAYDVGFNTINDFNRRFKTLFGMSPGAWREQQR